MHTEEPRKSTKRKETRLLLFLTGNYPIKQYLYRNK